jgi:hypothetical protein
MTQRVITFVEKQIKCSLPRQLAGYPIRKALSPGIIVTHPIRHRAFLTKKNSLAFILHKIKNALLGHLKHFFE